MGSHIDSAGMKLFEYKPNMENLPQKRTTSVKEEARDVV
jgi:hypothetical protein